MYEEPNVNIAGSESEGHNKPAILPSLPDVCNTAVILL